MSQSQNLVVLHFDRAPPTGAYEVSEVLETLKWTKSQSLVVDSPLKL